MHDLSTTLVAVGTPPGRGGIGCLRISGPRSSEIARGLFRAASRGASPEAGGPPGFGKFLDRQGRALDHGYLVLFAARASYTGEVSAELWTHGSPAVLAELVEAAVAAGALPAGPGEFTYRAMRNGRIDLSRAEAVRDLVDARTRYQARVAFSQADGAVAEECRRCANCSRSGSRGARRRWSSWTRPRPTCRRAALGQAIERARTECRELLAGFRAGSGRARWRDAGDRRPAQCRQVVSLQSIARARPGHRDRHRRHHARYARRRSRHRRGPGPPDRHGGVEGRRRSGRGRGRATRPRGEGRSRPGAAGARWLAPVAGRRARRPRQDRLRARARPDDRRAEQVRPAFGIRRRTESGDAADPRLGAAGATASRISVASCGNT